MHGEVDKFGWVEVDNAGFDVVTGVDEGEVIGFATREGIGVAGVFWVEDVGDGC